MSTANGYNYSPEYRRHVIDNSAEWQEISARCKERAGHRCQVCNNKPPFLHAHHRTYDRLEQEGELEDLIALCKKCHELFNEHKRPRNPEVLTAFKNMVEWLDADENHQIQITNRPFCVMKIDTRMGTWGTITAPNLQEHILQAINLIRALGRSGAP